MPLERLKLVIKFRIRVEYIMYLLSSDELPFNGRGQGHVTHVCPRDAAMLARY